MHSSKVDNRRPGFVAKMFSIDIKKDANKLKSNMRYDRKTATAAANDNRIIDYNGVRIDKIRQYTPGNTSPASICMLQSATIKFEQNQGRTMNEVKSQFEAPSNASQMEKLDNLELGFVNDPNFKVNVVGYASPIPTDLNGEMPKTAVKNNEILAMERANIGKAYLLDYIKNTLKIENFDESRISTSNGGILNAGADAQTIKYKPQ